MAAMTENSELDCVLNSLKSRKGPLTLDEILELSSLSSQEAEKALQRLEGQQKICSHLIREADTTVYSLNTTDGGEKCKLETQNTPKQPTITTPGAFKKQPFRSSSKLRQPFKSPLQTRQQTTVVEDEASLLKEIDSLKAKLEILDTDITDLSKEYSEEELQKHIEKLHEYNEIKDVGQLLLGKLAELNGTTTRAMYQEFGLDLED